MLPYRNVVSYDIYHLKTKFCYFGSTRNIDPEYARKPFRAYNQEVEIIPFMAPVNPYSIELAKEIRIEHKRESNYHYFYRVKKVDKLKHQRYEISMRILDLESKLNAGKFHKNEEKELVILRKKEKELDNKIENS